MPIIYNSLKSSDLDVMALTDPGRVTDVTAKRLHTPGEAPVDLLPQHLADQINTQRMNHSPPFIAVDLADMICDIVVETTVQGSSLLEVHLMDPMWMLLRRDPKTHASFIDVDPTGDGYLWPPIEVNFPPDVSDATWRLAQCKPTTDLTGANLILVFEDKIVAEMREHDAAGTDPTDPSLASSIPNETRAEFIKRCVLTVSSNKLPSDPSSVPIRFVPLLDPSDFTVKDLVGTEVTLPSSSTLQNTSTARQNPYKQSKLQQQLNSAVKNGTLGQLSPVPQLLENQPPVALQLGLGTLNGQPLGQILSEVNNGTIAGPGSAYGGK